MTSDAVLERVLQQLAVLEQRDAAEQATLQTLLAAVQRLVPDSDDKDGANGANGANGGSNERAHDRHGDRATALELPTMTEEQFVIVAATLARGGGPDARRRT